MRSLALLLFIVMAGVPTNASAQSCPPTDWRYAASGLPEGCPVDLVLPTDSPDLPLLYVWTNGQRGEQLTLTQVESRLVGTTILGCDQTCHVKTMGGGGRYWQHLSFTPTSAPSGTTLAIGDSVAARAEFPILASAACPTPPPMPVGFSCGEGCPSDCVPVSEMGDDGCAAAGSRGGAPPFALISLATLLVAWRGRGARRARRARDRA